MSKEYKGFSYKTSGTRSPQGKQKVFFYCHAEDYQLFFDVLTDEVLNLCPNIAIWYNDPQINFAENIDYWHDIEQMQLMIVPVTKKLIDFEKNKGEDSELRFAINHYIPVLPIQMELNVEEEFDNVFGDLHLLNRSQQEIESGQYAVNLKRFLDLTVHGEEIERKIYDEFHATVFLSYRKKDKEYAEKIMRILHSNDFCRDVAIWYDEFLVPGERFNDAIAKAIDDSDMFILTITPNVLEEKNYVLNIEYPKARSSGKLILPIEIAKTDKNKLCNLYEELPTVLEVSPWEQFANVLKNAMAQIGVSENNNDPYHQYMIGLAYLTGVYVEKELELATKLIINAADHNVIEAYEKIVSMYELGNGVRKDFEQAVRWQKKYIECIESGYEQGEISWIQIGHAYLKLSKLILKDTRTIKTETQIIETHKIGALEESMECLTHAIELGEQSIRNRQSIENKKMLATIYKEYAIFVYKETNSNALLKESIEYLERNICIWDDMLKCTGDSDYEIEMQTSRYWLRLCYIRLGTEQMLAKALQVSQQNSKYLSEHKTSIKRKIINVEFSPDGERILASYSNGDISIYDLQGNIKEELFGGFEAHQAISVSYDNEYVLWCGDTYVKLMSVKGKKCLRQIVLNDSHIRSASFSPDGRYIILIGIKKVFLLVVDTFEVKPARYEYRYRSVIAQGISSDGKMLFILYSNRCVYAYSVDSMEEYEWNIKDKDAPSSLEIYKSEILNMENSQLKHSKLKISTFWDDEAYYNGLIN